MKAAILHGPHNFIVEDIATPAIRPEQCLIRVRACGVCHSEIFQWDKAVPGISYPRHIGHEVSGEIIAVGKEVKNFKKGDRVAVWVDGKGYAEQIAVDEKWIFPLADEVTFAEAMAEPIACTTNGVVRADIQMGDTVALVGTGFMGLILLQEAKLRGAEKIIAVDLRDEMLAHASQLGADYVLNPQKTECREKIQELTGGRGVDVVFEVGGVQGTLDLAAAICRMEGKLVIFGYHPGQRVISDLGYWNWMAFDIINGHFRDQGKIHHGTRLGMQLLNAGKIRMKSLITHEYPLEHIEDAFLVARDKPAGFVKSVIVF